jgi:ATP-dependent DNA helicase RecQ
MFSYLNTHVQYNTVVKTILRTYGGIFEHQLAINLTLVADKSSVPEKQIIAILNQLHKDGIVDFLFSNTDSEVLFLQPREDDKTINRIANVVEHQQALKRAQIDAVLKFIDNDRICKNKQLLKYFGEITAIDCGICSVCVHHKISEEKKDSRTVTTRVILALEKSQMSSRQLVEDLPFEKNDVFKTLQSLLELDAIELTAANRYKIKTK